MFKIVGAFFIFVGITILTSGFTRGKNAVGAVIHNFLCLSCAFLFYWFIGFGFSFSKGNALIGYTRLPTKQETITSGAILHLSCILDS